MLIQDYKYLALEGCRGNRQTDANCGDAELLEESVSTQRVEGGEEERAGAGGSTEAHLRPTRDAVPRRTFTSHTSSPTHVVYLYVSAPEPPAVQTAIGLQ